MQICVLVHSEVTRQPGHSGYINGSQSCGVCVCACACGGVGHNAMFYGNMLCMFCSEFVEAQTSPGL